MPETSAQDCLVQIEPIFVGLEDAARMLAISPSTFKALDRKGGIGPMPARIQTVKRTLYRVDELRRWAMAGCPIRERWQKLQELS